MLFLPGLLGIRQYGVHMNGYIYDVDNELKMWIGRRSPTKPTYPGMLDNTVGKLCHCTRAVHEVILAYWGTRLTLTGVYIRSLSVVVTVWRAFFVGLKS